MHNITECFVFQAIKWRKENDIDNRLGGDPDPTLQERFPFYYDGLDKSGRPGNPIEVSSTM